MQNSDEQIMLLVKDGQLRLSATLYDRYSVLVYNYFLRRIYDRQLSEDLMQMVFERLIKYRNSFVEGKAFRSWLFTIARNIAIDELKRKKHSHMEDSMVSHIADTHTEASQDRKDTMLKAIGLLSAEDGEIIRLTKIHGFKHREVGEILDLTESNVKVKVHRAMKQLKNILINQLNYEYE